MFRADCRENPHEYAAIWILGRAGMGGAEWGVRYGIDSPRCKLRRGDGDLTSGVHLPRDLFAEDFEARASTAADELWPPVVSTRLILLLPVARNFQHI